MNWNIYIKGFKSFLSLEKSLSENSVEAYLHDVNKLVQFLEFMKYDISPKELQLKHLQEFVQWVNELGMTATSQARLISGIKGFYKYLLLENVLSVNPTALLEAPRLARKLPDTLSLAEINKLIDTIDLSRKGGQRNKAMLETLYSCGLRVSELVNLKVSNLFLMKIISKSPEKEIRNDLCLLGV